MIKLLCLDVDETLTNDDKIVTPGNIKACHELQTKYHLPIAICTGRYFQNALEIAHTICLPHQQAYVVYMNGAGVYDLNTNKILYEDIFSSAVNQHVYDFTVKNHIMAYFLTQENHQWILYHNFPVAEIDQYQHIKQRLTYHHDVLHATAKPLSRKELLNNQHKVGKWVLYLPEINVTTKVLEKAVIDEFNHEFELTHTFQDTFEINQKNTNKATGAEFIAKRYHSTLKEVAAMGDADNDYALLAKAGYSVAMGQASEHLKKVAKFITKSNNEDGVAHAIEQFIIPNLGTTNNN